MGGLFRVFFSSGSSKFFFLLTLLRSVTTSPRHYNNNPNTKLHQTKDDERAAAYVQLRVNTVQRAAKTVQRAWRAKRAAKTTSDSEDEDHAPDFDYIQWHMKTSSRANFVEFKAKHKT
jgi:hypothetical protein